MNLKAKAAPILVIITLASALYVAFPPRQSAVRAATTGVNVDPYDVNVNVSQAFTVNITIMDVENLWCFDITLSWNSSVLQLTGIDVRLSESDGVLHNPSSIVDNSTYQEQGRYTIAATSYAPASPFNGSGTVVRITFSATNTGYSKLELTGTDLYDWPPPDRDPRVSQPIPHDTVDGSCEVVPEFSELAAAALLGVTATFSIALSKRTRWRKREHLVPAPGDAARIYNCGKSTSRQVGSSE